MKLVFRSLRFRKWVGGETDEHLLKLIVFMKVCLVRNIITIKQEKDRFVSGYNSTNLNFQDFRFLVSKTFLQIISLLLLMSNILGNVFNSLWFGDEKQKLHQYVVKFNTAWLHTLLIFYDYYSFSSDLLWNTCSLLLL